MKDQLTTAQKAAINMQINGRKDPVYFGEKFLGMNFYPQQKLWLWLSTKTNRTEAKKLLVKFGICFTTEENIDKDLDSLYEKIDRHIFCVANQCGKTVMTAVKHIWSCYFKIGKQGDSRFMELDDYKTLNTSPHSDQANKCFEYVQRICRGEMIWFDPENKKITKNEVHPAMSDFITGVNSVEKEIRFINGSTFWSKSSGQDKGTARAGEQFGLITYDEASQSLHLEKTIPALLSRLIRYGYCFDIISTPEAEKPSHAYYMKLVKDGVKLKNGWFALTNITLDDNVFIDPMQKEKAKESIKTASPAKYQQMILGKFIDIGQRLFSVHTINHMFSNPDIKQLQSGIPTKKYVLSADWSMADTGDKTWFFVLDYTDYMMNKYNIVYHQVIDGGEPQIQYAVTRDIYHRFGGDNQVKFIMDASSMGGTIIKKELMDLKPISFTYQHGRKGEMLMFLNLALTFDRKIGMNDDGEMVEKNPDYGKIRSYYIQELEDQLSNYRTEDKKLEQDAVMALGQAIWWIEKLPKNKDIELDLNPMSRYNIVRSNKGRYSRYG